MDRVAAARQPIDTRGALTMAAVCACWSLQHIAIKLAAADMTPVMQVGVRSALAGLLVWAEMTRRRIRVSPRDPTLVPGAAIGVLFAGTFLCVAVGLSLTSASRTMVFLYSAPLFTAIGLHLLVPEERLSRLQWAGAALAFAGLAVALHSGEEASGEAAASSAVGDLAALAAGVLWGATTVVIRTTTLASTPAIKTLLYQLVGAGLLVTAFAVATHQGGVERLTPRLGASLAFQVVVVGFASFLAWFSMLRKYLASRLSVMAYMTPVFGAVFGALILGEHLDATFVTGAVLMLAGVLLVNR